MLVVIQGKTDYRTTEVYRAVGISRNTLLRWLNEASRGSLKSGWKRRVSVVGRLQKKRRDGDPVGSSDSRFWVMSLTLLYVVLIH